MSAPTSSPSQAEREAAGTRGTLPGKVHVLPGGRVQADDGAAPIETPAVPVPTGWDVAKIAAASLACAVLAGWVAIAAVNSPVLAGLVAVAFVVPPLLEARRWWRGRRG